MRILAVPPRYFPHVGGVENVTRELTQRLAARGHHLTVLCADEPRGAPRIVDGIAVERLRTIAKLANTNVTPALPWRLARAKFDLAHAHLPTPWSADWTCLVAALRRRPAVLTYYNRIVGDGRMGAIAGAYERCVLPITLRLASVVLVQSPTWAADLAARFPAMAPKIVCVENGVDTARFRPGRSARRETTLLFVGLLDAFHAYKGLDVLFEALAACPSARLRVVGDGPERITYEARARALGVGSRVAFLGAVDDDELVEAYQSATVFVLPSNDADHEGGSSLVVLEALACGLPAIVADGAGVIASVVEEEGIGRKVPAGDAAALAGAIEEVLASPDARETMSRRARAWVLANASWDSVVDRIEAVYAGALRARGSSGRR